MAQLWVVEDDPSIGPSLVRALEAEGYTVDLAASAGAALALTSTPDVVLLDLGLPDADGIDLANDLGRRHPGLRIVMLTARSEEIDVVLGLDAGAVDYITKPFRLAELLARVRAQLRNAAAPRESIVVGDLTIDLLGRRVHVAAVEVELRPKEFDLLARLAAEPGTVVRREVLMSDVWDEHWFGDTKTLDVHISALRRRLAAAAGTSDSAGPGSITTLRGVGYRLEAST